MVNKKLKSPLVAARITNALRGFAACSYEEHYDADKGKDERENEEGKQTTKDNERDAHTRC